MIMDPLVKYYIPKADVRDEVLMGLVQSIFLHLSCIVGMA